MTPNQARHRAGKFATTSTEAALKAARSINDPWYGCQSLAWVARFAPDHLAESAAAEAIEVADRALDPYKVVGASAWPVRALVERGRTARLPAILHGLLAASDKIEPPSSRSEALFLLFQAAFPAGRSFWEPVLPKLITPYEADPFWRQGRNVRDALLITASVDDALSRELCSRLPAGRWRGQLERRLERRAFQRPRVFFW